MLKKKIFIFLILLITVFPLSGCNNYQELNNVMIIDGIGIDKKDDEYIVSFNTYNQNNKYETYKITTSNINDSFNKIYLKVSKKIYLSHLNILALSSNLDNLDIENIINAFNRRQDLRGSFNVVLIHNYEDNFFKNDSLKIKDILHNNYLEKGNVYPTTFNDLINDYLDLNIAYIPIIDNKTNTLMGMHSLFSEFNFYDLTNSSFLNLLENKLETLTLTIDEDEVNCNNTEVKYLVDKNNVKININFSYNANVNKNKIISYIDSNINNFLSNDYNLNYFYDLIKKKDYLYYKDNPKPNIIFDITYNLSKEEINNIKDGDLIEENDKY